MYVIKSTIHLLEDNKMDPIKTILGKTIRHKNKPYKNHKCYQCGKKYDIKWDGGNWQYCLDCLDKQAELGNI